ncbi:BtrH N-terminal domain-containing protein [Pelolinea submarina]|uniref:Butirosin biosynthesis protein H-like n=1 Tax=Pelolinea submarina TaxID=913107 RepID=A0A347ZSE2_9CHLR|nr:BtrH N-terminal domain-containing protein [Pelolinea submarina]REG11212.1 butirosin biosynthesis protein H-like [Pelolinea submarina]BBB48223.1 hypothetical protein Pelsub_P1451 [Pelolinea submarina]
MKIIPGFEFLETKHCVTGSILHVFRFHRCLISEEMLFGLGDGIGFIYWQPKGDLPFMGGRANTARKDPQDCLEVLAAERCGVRAVRNITAGSRKAEKALLDHLNADEPLALQVDMGLLPYFPFFEKYHFGYHLVTAAGYDPQSGEVTLADRDAQPYPVQLTQLNAARGSTFKPFLPQNAWMEYDFSGFHQPTDETLIQAMRKCAEDMLNPPIRSMGIQGIHTACRRILAWPEIMDNKSISEGSLNLALYVRADAGTGGGLFRWMYADFLRECAQRLGKSALITAADDLQTAGNLWEAIADQLEQVHNASDLRDRSAQITALFNDVAAAEQSAWSGLIAAIS